MLAYVFHFLSALLFSVVVETVVILVLCKVYKKPYHIALLAALGTMCTIPYVWFVFPTLFWYSSAIALYLAEGFAFVFESFIYRFLGKVTWKQAIVFSLIANSVSYFLGKIFL
jgi:hypothetical protein